MTTPYAIISQHYRTKRWSLDSLLLDEEGVRRAQDTINGLIRSTAPVHEIIKVSPPVDITNSRADDFKVVCPERGGDFYHIEGRTFEVISRHQCKPWKPL